ncbi:MAG: hypothetical protein M0R46_10055 [Candidatus Muirbacterium halophilum]|nr:hypothetical protein [Candidatus Muirbacterium halophilum]
MTTTEEYIVSDIKQVTKFIDKEIGIDFEVTKDDDLSNSGSIVAFDITSKEDNKVRDFISKNNYWLSKTQDIISSMSQNYLDDYEENPTLLNDIKNYLHKTDFGDTSVKIARHYLGDGKHKIFLNYFDENSQCEIKDDFNFRAWDNKENLHTFLDLTIDTFNKQKEYLEKQNKITTVQDTQETNTKIRKVR